MTLASDLTALRATADDAAQVIGEQRLRIAELEAALAAIANYSPSVTRALVDRIWRGFTTNSGYAPVPDLPTDPALCDLIAFDDFRSKALAALARTKTNSQSEGADPCA